MSEDLRALQLRVVQEFKALDAAFTEAESKYPPGSYMSGVTLWNAYRPLAERAQALHRACQGVVDYVGGAAK